MTLLGRGCLFRRGLVLGATVLCGVLIPAMTAGAQPTATSGYAEVVSGVLTYSPPTGAPSDVRVTLSPVGEIVLEEAAAGISPGPGCHPYAVVPRPSVACAVFTRLRTIYLIEARFGEQDDRMDASAIIDQQVFVHGGAGDDSLTTGQMNDFIRGGDGDDTIVAQGSYDHLEGGDGDDRMFGGPDGDDVDGGPGVNTMDGGSDSGIDYLSFRDSPAGVTADLVSQQLTYLDTAGSPAGTAIGFEGVYGSDHDDRIFGDDLDNTVLGGFGNDQIHGRAGDDNLGGHSGDDLLLGGAGADELQGWAGNDEIHGGEDDDDIRGFEGADTLYGDGGEDLVSGEEGDDEIRGGEAFDILFGGDGDDSITGDGGFDYLRGFEGADRLYAQDGESDAADCGDDTPLDTVEADRIDDVSSNCESVITPNEAPVDATITAPRSVRTGEATAFTGSASDPDADPFTFHWEFGDGSVAEGANVTHTYLSKGRYMSRLTVTDDHGGSVAVQHAVHVIGGS